MFGEHGPPKSSKFSAFGGKRRKSARQPPYLMEKKQRFPAVFPLSNVPLTPLTVEVTVSGKRAQWLATGGGPWRV